MNELNYRCAKKRSGVPSKRNFNGAANGISMGQGLIISLWNGKLLRWFRVHVKNEGKKRRGRESVFRFLMHIAL